MLKSIGSIKIDKGPYIGELGVSGPLKHFLSGSNLQCMQMKTEMVPTDHPLNSLHTKHISVCSYQIK